MFLIGAASLPLTREGRRLTTDCPIQMQDLKWCGNSTVGPLGHVQSCSSQVFALARSAKPQVLLQHTQKQRTGSRLAICTAFKAATQDPTGTQQAAAARSEEYEASGAASPVSRPGGEEAEEVSKQLAVLEHWQQEAVKGYKPNPYYVRQFRVQEQLCMGCQETKPAEEFHRAQSRESGLSELCRQCQLQDLSQRLKATEVASKNEAALEVDGLKTCYTCGETKPMAEYTNAQLALRPPRGSCQKCMRQKQNQYYKVLDFKEPAVSEQPCLKCGVVKPAAAFHRRKLAKNGIGSTCRECTSKYNLQMRLLRKLKAESEAASAV